MTEFNNAYNQKITLTEEQERCLNYHLGEKTLMIKGYAGAGKSLVLQANALKYINMYPAGRRDHKIGLFTYTNALITTTRELLDANPGGKDVFTSTLDKYLIDVYKAMGGPYIKLYDGKIRQDNIKQALEIHKGKNGPHRFHDLESSTNGRVDTLKFWEEEIDWMKGMNVSPDDKEYCINLQRRGRGSSIRMSTKDREVAFEIFCTYCELIKKKGCGDWADFAVYINKRLKEYTIAKQSGKNPAYPIPSQYMFDMILLDEAQDLSLAQMLAVMGLFNKAIIIAMDAHQRIYPANWTAKQLGIETKTEWLKKSMRNTVEIDALAESLRQKNEIFFGTDEKEKRAIPYRHGDKPIICGFEDSSQEKSFVINQIKTWLKESSEIRIGIICVTKYQVEKYNTWCEDAGISREIIKKDSTFSMKTPGVKILNAYNAKGLEFFRVIIPEFAEGSFPFKIKKEDPEDIELELCHWRSLAYVAMTRAQESLIITYSGKHPSRFIGEMDDDLYEKRGTVTTKVSPQSRKTTSRTTTNTFASRPSKKATSVNKTETSSLLEFFQSKGFECVDKRSKAGGSLWVVGTREKLVPVIREAQTRFGDLGNNNFAEHGGKATGYRAAWFMTSDK